MIRVIVIYESKYGNTKLVAENIIEGMRGTPGIDITMSYVTEVKPELLTGYDFILIGAPNHMGTAAKSTRKFIDSMEDVNLEGKEGALFDTYMYKDYGKAVNNMEKQLAEKVPGLKLIEPSLSLLVNGMKGPLANSELPKAVDFGRQLTEKITA